MMTTESPMDHRLAREIAEQISSGHAFQVHVLEEDGFPEIKSREEFADLIFQVLTDPAAARRNLREGREAYWSDVHQAVVILDLMSDGGTAFRPRKGKSYFRGLI
jgi:hypothetical protein